jgi:LSM domain
LYNAVRGNTQVLVNVRNNHKLLGRVKAYDRHMNLYVFFLSLWSACVGVRKSFHGTECLGVIYVLCVFAVVM